MSVRVAVQRSAGINARVFDWKAVGMSDLVWLTLVRYPPRVLSEGMGNRGMRVAVWRLAAWVLALVWFPAGFHVASAVAAGEMRWPADIDSWLMLAVLAPAGLPLATACGGLWRRGHGVAAWAAVVVLVPAIVGGGVAADPFGLVAVAVCAVVASLPAWLLYGYLRLYRRAPRRGFRRRAV